MSAVNTLPGRFTGAPRRGSYARKSNKNTQTGLREVKPSLFTGTIIMHVENPHEHSQETGTVKTLDKFGCRARDRHSESTVFLHVCGLQPRGSEPTSASSLAWEVVLWRNWSPSNSFFFKIAWMILGPLHIYTNLRVSL